RSTSSPGTSARCGSRPSARSRASRWRATTRKAAARPTAASRSTSSRSSGDEQGMEPPFRVEHIGSFLRPQRLLEAARAHKANRLDEKEFHAIQDESIRDIVAFQESLGLPSVTDGEFRRRSWSAGFIDAVDGFGLRDGTLTFRNESSIIGVAASPYARAPLRRKHRIVADDYRFLRSTVKSGVPKVRSEERRVGKECRCRWWSASVK